MTISIDKIYFQCFRSLCTPHPSNNQRITASVQTARSSSMKRCLIQGPLSTEKYQTAHNTHTGHMSIIIIITIISQYCT